MTAVIPATTKKPKITFLASFINLLIVNGIEYISKECYQKDVTALPSFGKIFNTLIPAFPRFFHKLLIP